MKPKAKIILATALLAGIAGGTAAIVSSSPSTTAEIVAEAEQNDRDKGLPGECNYFSNTGHPKAVACKDGELASIAKNPLVQKTTWLEVSNVAFDGTSMEEFTHLNTLIVQAPRNPERLSETITTVPNLKTLSLTDPLPAPMDFHVKSASLNLVDVDVPGLNQRKSIDPKFSANSITSDTFYELSNESAAKVKTLSVMGTVQDENIDLSPYTSLKTLSIEISKDSTLRLPAHMRDGGDFDMNDVGNKIQFIAPSHK